MKKLLMLSSFLLLAGCTSVAQVKTTTTSPIQSNGRPVGDVSFLFDHHSGGTTLITATTSEGEVFKGNAISEKTQMEVDNGEGVDCVTINHADGKQHSECRTYDKGSSVESIRTGIWYATLISNLGNSMDCTFNSTYMNSAFVYGAIGNCQMSDGKNIPLSLTNEATEYDEKGKVIK